jgi:hypothetical protein
MSIIRFFRLHVATVLVMLAASNTYAASVVVKQTVDLNNCTTPINICTTTDAAFAGLYFLPAPIRLLQGDSVVVEVTFLPGQRLSLASDGGFSMFTGWLKQDTNLSPPNSSWYTLTDVTYSLSEPIGNLSIPFSTVDQTSGSAAIGPFYQNTLSAGETISFTGYRTSFDIAYLLNGSSYYDATWMSFNADHLAITAVPEPSSSTLLLTGAFILILTTWIRACKGRPEVHSRTAGSLKKHPSSA